MRRRFAERARGTPAADLGPLELAAKDLPPMEVRLFRWWEDEVAAIKAAAEEPVVADVDEEEEEATGKGRKLKKRSINALCTEVPAVEDAVGGPSAVVDEEEVIGTMVRRSKEMRRRRRLEAAPATEPEPSAAAERRAPEGNFARKVCGPAQPDPTRPTPCLPASCCLHHDIVSSCSNVCFLLLFFYCD